SAHFEPHKLTLEDYFKEFINPQHTPDTPLTVYSSSFVPNQEKKNKMDVKKTTVVGISVRTINRENQAMIDISALWQRFMQEGVMNKIDNKVNNHIWAIYHNYEGDHLAPYSCTLGCEVSSMSKLPAEFDAVEINPGEYKKFTVKGSVSDNSVGKKWYEIWGEDLERTYKSDFELYTEKAQNPEDMEVDIFIGVK
ncbi:MAG: GyrI-like domain-containing protein, partial [Flavobacteriales bacterium]